MGCESQLTLQTSTRLTTKSTIGPQWIMTSNCERGEGSSLRLSYTFASMHRCPIGWSGSSWPSRLGPLYFNVGILAKGTPGLPLAIVQWQAQIT